MEPYNDLTAAIYGDNIHVGTLRFVGTCYKERNFKLMFAAMKGSRNMYSNALVTGHLRSYFLFTANEETWYYMYLQNFNLKQFFNIVMEK